MKKSALMMSLAMALSLSACGNNNGGNNSTNNGTNNGGNVTGEVIEEGDDCDGSKEYACSNGTLFNCYSLFGLIQYWMEVETCSNDNPCVIRESDGYGSCGKTCNAGDTGSASCSLNQMYTESYGEDIYSTKKSSCDKATDGNYYFFNEEAFCNHDCDGNACRKLSADEGNLCNIDSEFTERCDEGNILVFCNYGSVVASSCEQGLSCKVMANMNYADCTKPCGANDSDTGTCDTSYKQMYDVEVFNLYKCVDVKGGGKAAFNTGNSINCSSCSSGECVNNNKGENAKIGDNCNYYLFQDRCAGNDVIACTKEGVVATKDCQANEKCIAATSDDYVGYADCHDLSEINTCTSGAADIYKCDQEVYEGETYYFSTLNSCIDFVDGNTDDHSLLMLVDYEECEGRCNSTTGLCE